MRGKKSRGNTSKGIRSKSNKTDVALHAQRQRLLREQKVFLLEQNKHKFYHTDIPPTACEFCAAEHEPKDDFDDGLDENGYPLIKKNMLGSELHPMAQLRGPALKLGPVPSSKKRKIQPFRFLDLPHELRIYIYEFVFSSEKQVVFINDDILLPSTGMPNAGHVPRQCKAQLICIPCQLHNKLGTGSIGLTRASRQLHSETAPIPYKINTLSVHNIYYLQTFLQLIGPIARKHLKHIRFDWKLPEEISRALSLDVNLHRTYKLLLDCTNLSTLWIDMDVVNLLTWRVNGLPRSAMLTDVSQMHAMEFMYGLRELKDIRIRWKKERGLVMESWVKAVMGVWREPRESDGSNVSPVDTEMTIDAKKEWCCVHWKRE